MYKYSYLTQVHDNTLYQKKGHLTLQQISAEISQVQEVFQMKIIAICTNSKSD